MLQGVSSELLVFFRNVMERVLNCFNLNFNNLKDQLKFDLQIIHKWGRGLLMTVKSCAHPFNIFNSAFSQRAYVGAQSFQ